MFKVNNKDTVVLVSLLLTLNTFQPRSSVSIVNSKHLIPRWVVSLLNCQSNFKETYEFVLF